MGQKIAAYNSDGLLVAFYDSVDSPPPDGLDSVDISEAQWGEYGAALSAGHELKKGVDGLPVAFDQIVVPQIPASISPAQARIALHHAGLLEAVNSAVAAADIATQIAWSSATSFERGSPTVATLGAALNLTESAVDNLFMSASKINI